jgi:very-short-patch-repair endonuclease
MRDVSNSLEDWETVLDLFQKLCRQELGVEVEAEFYFAKPRRWRFDYAIVEQRIAVEVEGGVWTRGRHTRGAGFLKDLVKYNEAAVRGWTLIRTTPDTLVSQTTLDLIRRAIETRKAG